MWITGTYKNYTYQAKVFDEGSDYGIDFDGDGKISKLLVKKENEVICHYDRGDWDVLPTEEHMDDVSEIIRLHN